MKLLANSVCWIFVWSCLVVLTNTADPVHHVRLHKDPSIDSCTIISEEQLRKFRQLTSKSSPCSASNGDSNEVYVKESRAQQPPGDSMLEAEDKTLIVDVYSRSQAAVQGHIAKLCKSTRNLPALKLKSGGSGPRADPEVIPIITSGDKANRIDVVFMGDGYLASERQAFIDDMQRLVTDMFEGETFRSYLPVFNIWAIFVESNESGIGYFGSPKDTPFRLYRQAGQLRAIFPGNSTYARQVCALTGPSGCDYPSIIANDDFYGGLGGEFVISTKSALTGTIVLRHEMGHNFIDVGEEYDGGGVYSGVNYASSVATLGWTSWLSGARREERAMYRLLAYPWKDLSTGPSTHTFTSDGTYSRWYITVSVTAAPRGSLRFELDGRVLPWESTGSEDREFYDWANHTAGFSTGSHTFIVRSLLPPSHPSIPRMIASIDIHEFGSEDEFVIDNNHVSAYPTWSSSYRKTFRPTNAGCLMRNMTHAQFCTVCKEGMWHQFLSRISLIDSVGVNGRNATVHTLQLGKWRPPGNEVEGETLQIRWYHNSVDQAQYNDQHAIENIATGSWRVSVKLITPEVHEDPNGLLEDEESFVIN